MIGHKKIYTTTWVNNTLERNSTDHLELEHNDQQLMDFNYELSDVV